VPGLAAQGLDAARLLVLQGPALASDAAARVWACEQALRCAGVSAVLAWLPQVRPEQLRRLQMAAQNFQQQLFVMRPLAAQQEASPAVLRLLLEAGEGADALTLRLLKRRGPPLTMPLVLPARPERLQALLAASRQQSVRRRPPARSMLTALVSTRVPAGAALSPSGGPGALDRLAAPAAR
jgi:protein ImuA